MKISLNQHESLTTIDQIEQSGIIRPAQASLLRRLVRQGVVFEHQPVKGKPFMVMDVVEFLNHGIDTRGMNLWGQDLAEQLRSLKANKIITVKSGGIAITHAVATALGEIDYVCASKGTSLVLTQEESYVSANRSYTESRPIELVVAKRSLKKKDRVIMIDDFLDYGDTTIGVADLCQLSGAQLVGAGFLIEKSAAGGRKRLDEGGLNIPIVNVIKVQRLELGRMLVAGIDKFLYINETIN